jgi:hydroxyacylglutathione hydrolase
MILRYLYHRELAQASYLVGCAATGEALIVDPNRDVEQYLELASAEGLRITAITETHIHADFVSGARELASRTGAALYLSDEGPDEWKYAFAGEPGIHLVKDGDAFTIGNIRVEVVHTPGHTPEHISFVVTDTAGADRPMGIFTGDFVFVGDVGRPDLLERAAGYAGTMEAGARRLFHSIQRFKQLPDFVQVWPGHGAGSACGRALGAVPQSTIGYERLFNWAFQIDDEDRFVEEVLAGQPEAPVYFAQMKRINKVGPALLEDLAEPAQHPEHSIMPSASAGMTVVDSRSASAYARAHIPGTINIPLDGAFVTWAGWLVPYDQPFGLIVDPDLAQHAVKELRMIGLDNLESLWTPAVYSAWRAAGNKLATIAVIDPADLDEIDDGSNAVLIDVRGGAEYEEGHIPGSRNIPLGYLEDHLDEIPADAPVVLNCRSGQRSAIAASLLARHGRTNVKNLSGGFDAWRSSKTRTRETEAATTATS